MAPDVKSLEEFIDLVLAKEKVDGLRKIAQELKDDLPNLRKAIEEFQAKRKVSRTEFEAAWTEIHKSAGKRGDYQALTVASSIGDVARLKALRERILQHGSDEAFHDSRKVNDIIIPNRFGEKPAPRRGRRSSFLSLFQYALGCIQPRTRVRARIFRSKPRDQCRR
jgi:hypothetical protein